MESSALVLEPPGTLPQCGNPWQPPGPAARGPPAARHGPPWLRPRLLRSRQPGLPVPAGPGRRLRPRLSCRAPRGSQGKERWWTTTETSARLSRYVEAGPGTRDREALGGLRAPHHSPARGRFSTPTGVLEAGLSGRTSTSGAPLLSLPWPRPPASRQVHPPHLAARRPGSGSGPRWWAILAPEN